MSLGDRGHNLLEGIFYGVEAGTVVVNPLCYQGEDSVVYRVVGGARAVDGRAECVKDYGIYWQMYLGWKVELPLRDGPYLFYIMTT